MFRVKASTPAADAERYLPELRAWAKKRYRPKASSEIRYSLAPMLPEDWNGLSADDRILDEKDARQVASLLKNAGKDLSVFDSPAVKRYYHSWEKKKSVTRTFSSEVMRMVKEKYKKASEFYLPAGIDKRTFHKIKSDYLYKPSRSTAMKCCLGLRLGETEAKELLQLAGYSFSLSDPSDLVVLFCLEKEIWDLASVNYLMDSFDLKDLDGYVPE